MSARVHTFSIAEHIVRIFFAERQYNGMFLLPAFRNFAVEASDETSLIDFVIDDTTNVVDKSQRQRVRVFKSGNGDIIVDSLTDGGYQFIVKDTNNYECALLIANSDFSKCRCALRGNYDMRCFGLNSILMISYAFAGCLHGTLMIHSSLVRHKGKGYAFNAKSGTGKSTQVSMWLRYIPDCELMNDDNPIIRVIDDGVYIYGSPWSGKTPCYRNIKAPLAAITRIHRATTNHVERLDVLNAVASLLPSCSAMRWDNRFYDHTLKIIQQIIEHVSIYKLHCLPNREAALVCKKSIVNEE